MRKLLLLISLLPSAICYSQSGQLDPLFGNHGIVKSDLGPSFDYNSNGKQVLIGPGGSIYIVADDPTYVSKRFPNGSIDSTYGFYGYSRQVTFRYGYATLQSDGKIIIVGSGFGVARIDSKGMTDSSFGNNGMTTGFNGTASANSVAVQADGKIVVVGENEVASGAYFAVARYNANGSPDTSFNHNGELTADFGLKAPPERDGLDSIPFHAQGATTIAIQADGKIVVGGHASNERNIFFAVARYNVNGSLDNTFNHDGLQITSFGPSSTGYSLAIQKDGKILLAGYTYVGSNTNFAIVRYKTDGQPDSSFNANGLQTVNLIGTAAIRNSMAIQGDGKIVVAGYEQNGSSNDFTIVRFNSDGSIDNNFNKDGIIKTDFSSSDDEAGSVAIQDDNKIVVVGSANFTVGPSVLHLAVSRYNPNGELDSSFAENGKLVGGPKQGNTMFFASAIQTDGKIIEAGICYNGINNDFVVARFNNNGSIDSSFNKTGSQLADFGLGNNYANSVAIQKDGKIIVAGTSNSQFAVLRYNNDGSPDNTFHSSGKLVVSVGPTGSGDECRSVAIQSDGKIVLAGYSFTSGLDSTYSAIARLKVDGTLDSSFGKNGKQLSAFNSLRAFTEAVAIQNDGKIVASGYNYLNGKNNFLLIRYNTNGSFDTSFANHGRAINRFGTDNYYSVCVAIQSDGKIVAGGYSETDNASKSSFAVARYSPNGSLDSTFGVDGFQSTNLGPQLQFATSVSITEDQRIILGGSNGNFGLVLYKSDGSLDNSFGKDGIQVTNIGTADSRINSVNYLNGKIYASGYGQYPGYLGVIARYLLFEGGPLPVSLLDFTGVLQNKSVVLNWKIATQKTLSGFVIERGADGNSFLPINRIPVSGGSTSSGNYLSRDDQPLQGINFYRLKIIDINGQFTYSNIVAVKMKSGTRLQIFPNPVHNILFVRATGNPQNAIVQIVDEGGRKVKEIKVYLSGETSFSTDISNLPAGQYNLILHTKEKTEVQAFIKR